MVTSDRATVEAFGVELRIFRLLRQKYNSDACTPIENGVSR